jgi:hypothetical protein
MAVRASGLGPILAKESGLLFPLRNRRLLRARLGYDWTPGIWVSAIMQLGHLHRLERLERLRSILQGRINEIDKVIAIEADVFDDRENATDDWAETSLRASRRNGPDWEGEWLVGERWRPATRSASRDPDEEMRDPDEERSR